MWKYFVAAFFLFIGSVELFLALNANAREAVMKNSLVRSKSAEPKVLLLAGLSAIVMGLGILFFKLFW